MFVFLEVFVANEVVLLVPCVVLFVNPVELVNAVFLLVFVFLEVLFVNPVESTCICISSCTSRGII